MKCPFCEGEHVGELPLESAYRRIPLVDVDAWRKCADCGAEFRMGVPFGPIHIDDNPDL